jgi:hypothetical protein
MSIAITHFDSLKQSPSLVEKISWERAIQEPVADSNALLFLTNKLKNVTFINRAGTRLNRTVIVTMVKKLVESITWNFMIRY